MNTYDMIKIVLRHPLPILRYIRTGDIARVKEEYLRLMGVEWKKGQDYTDLVSKFHKLFYASSEKIYENTHWMGVRVRKNALDLWIYQEILFEVKPDIIIESGTAYGGSALFLAHLCDILGKGHIISIDIRSKKNLPQHKRITYMIGNSISIEVAEAVEKIVSQIKDSGNSNLITMVILDSDHSKKHVLQEMNFYNKYVSVGSYLIVEDTNINGHPVFEEFGPGPYEAVEEFMRANPDFIIDKSREKYFVSFNPNGFLKRIR